MKVKIIDCFFPSFWYAEALGGEFVVCDHPDDPSQFMVLEDYEQHKTHQSVFRLIKKEDCEIIE